MTSALAQRITPSVPAGAPAKPGTGTDHPMAKMAIAMRKMFQMPELKEDELESKAASMRNAFKSREKEWGLALTDDQLDQAAATLSEHAYEGTITAMTFFDPTVPPDQVLERIKTSQESLRHRLFGILSVSQAKELLPKKSENTRPGYLYSLQLNQDQIEEISTILEASGRKDPSGVRRLRVHNFDDQSTTRKRSHASETSSPSRPRKESSNPDRLQPACGPLQCDSFSRKIENA